MSLCLYAGKQHDDRQQRAWRCKLAKPAAQEADSRAPVLHRRHRWAERVSLTVPESHNSSGDRTQRS